jgi:hypothetical protein
MHRLQCVDEYGDIPSQEGLSLRPWRPLRGHTGRAPGGEIYLSRRGWRSPIRRVLAAAVHRSCRFPIYFWYSQHSKDAPTRRQMLQLLLALRNNCTALVDCILYSAFNVSVAQPKCLGTIPFFPDIHHPPDRDRRSPILWVLPAGVQSSGLVSHILLVLPEVQGCFQQRTGQRSLGPILRAPSFSIPIYFRYMLHVTGFFHLPIYVWYLRWLYAPGSTSAGWEPPTTVRQVPTWRESSRGTAGRGPPTPVRQVPTCRKTSTGTLLGEGWCIEPNEPPDVCASPGN